MKLCMDCENVFLSGATCLHPVYHTNFRRYSATECENFSHRIHSEVSVIMTSDTVQRRQELTQVVHA